MFERKCNRCRKKGHKDKICCFNKKSVKSNDAATSSAKEKSEDCLDAEAFFCSRIRGVSSYSNNP